MKAFVEGVIRRPRPALFLLLLVLAMSARAFDRPPPPGGAGSHDGEIEIVFVADGDTVKAKWRGGAEWIRLLRIDTPERDERGYVESRAALKAMVLSRPVAIAFEKRGVPERDDYKRLLAYLLADGENINVEMVRAGWSPFWTRYGEGRHASQFRRAEAEARREGRGLWGMEGARP